MEPRSVTSSGGRSRVAVVLAVLTLANTALIAATNIYGAEERGELRSDAGEIADRSELTCGDMERLRSDLIQVLAIAPSGTSSEERSDSQDFVERAAEIIDQPSCRRPDQLSSGARPQ